MKATEARKLMVCTKKEILDIIKKTAKLGLNSTFVTKPIPSKLEKELTELGYTVHDRKNCANKISW